MLDINICELNWPFIVCYFNIYQTYFHVYLEYTFYSKTICEQIFKIMQKKNLIQINHFYFSMVFLWV